MWGGCTADTLRRGEFVGRGDPALQLWLRLPTGDHGLEACATTAGSGFGRYIRRALQTATEVDVMRNMRKWSLIAGLAAVMQFTVVCDLPNHGSIGGIDYDVYYEDDYYFDFYHEDDCWFDCDDDDWFFDFDFDW